ncbi:MAG: hypothetical protein AB7F53_01775 [Nitrososphaeraceae archaeon]
MSSEQILNEEKSSRNSRRRRDKPNLSNKERKEDKLQEIKLPQSIIYEPSENNNNQQSNLSLTASDNDNNQDQRRQITNTNTHAKEITDYYLTFHKNIINIYNSIYSQILQDISNSYKDSYFTVNERIFDYSIQIENMYNSLNSKRDKSLKLVDNIITENLDTYIKSIKQAQKFYKDVTASYLNSIRQK